MPAQAALPAPTGLTTVLPLLWLASPALPIGGFSYSEGLEAAIDRGRVHDEHSTAAWLLDQLLLGQARADLSVLAEALPAWHRQDHERLQALDTWVRETRESAELRLQTEQMGRSLMEWWRQLAPAMGLHASQPVWPAAGSAPTYPVAFAFALSRLLPADAPVASAVAAAAFSWSENQVQAALKAVPLGQAAGQRVLAQLVAAIPTAVQTALDTPAAERQAYCPMLAILSAQHETQYSRLFRS